MINGSWSIVGRVLVVGIKVVVAGSSVWFVLDVGRVVAVVAGCRQVIDVVAGCRQARWFDRWSAGWSGDENCLLMLGQNQG